MEGPNDQWEERARDGAPAARRVLVVEDDPLVRLMLEETLAEHGFIVAGTAKTLAAGLDLAGAGHFDVALLDVSLGPDRIDPIADLLARRRRPFVFATGYGRAGLPPAHAGRPAVEKPFRTSELIAVLHEALRQARGEDRPASPDHPDDETPERSAVTARREL